MNEPGRIAIYSGDTLKLNGVSEEHRKLSSENCYARYRNDQRGKPIVAAFGRPRGVTLVFKGPFTTSLGITPAEAFTHAPNKDGHRIAHWLAWILGGSAACDALRLRTAQERGMGTKLADGEWKMACRNFQIGSDADMTPALNWLSQNLGGKGTATVPVAVSGVPPETSSPSTINPQLSSLRIGLGFDVATTTKGKSNPSVLSVMEERGPEWLVRCRFIWRTADPETANQRIEAILSILECRGLRPKALAQDATNERYYAEQNLQRFRRRLPVILVVASQSVDKPGLDKPINWKEYLGHQLVAKLDDNNLTLPPDDYTRVDYRLVMKDRGKFVCEPNDQGMHGDCFDADKLAGHALTAAASRNTIVPPMHMMYPLDPSEEERLWS